MAKRERLLIKLDEICSRIYNIKQSFRPMDKRMLSKNAELKELKKEKDFCFVIGNGPSLKNVDLSIIEKYDCFTVNEFHRGNDKFTSKYHVIIDGAYCDREYDYITKIRKDNPDSVFILRDVIYKHLAEDGYPQDKMYCIYPDLVNYGEFLKCDVTKRMTGSMNVIPVVIECAISMGFKKIYLLGCDLNGYASTTYTHYYKGKDIVYGANEVPSDLIRFAFVHNQHFALSEFAKRNGVEIINLTEGSLITAYKRDKLENIALE